MLMKFTPWYVQHTAKTWPAMGKTIMARGEIWVLYPCFRPHCIGSRIRLELKINISLRRWDIVVNRFKMYIWKIVLKWCHLIWAIFDSLPFFTDALILDPLLQGQWRHLWTNPKESNLGLGQDYRREQILSVEVNGDNTISILLILFVKILNLCANEYIVKNNCSLKPSCQMVFIHCIFILNFVGNWTHFNTVQMHVEMSWDN